MYERNDDPSFFLCYFSGERGHPVAQFISLRSRSRTTIHAEQSGMRERSPSFLSLLLWWREGFQSCNSYHRYQPAIDIYGEESDRQSTPNEMECMKGAPPLLLVITVDRGGRTLHIINRYPRRRIHGDGAGVIGVVINMPLPTQRPGFCGRNSTQSGFLSEAAYLNSIIHAPVPRPCF